MIMKLSGLGGLLLMNYKRIRRLYDDSSIRYRFSCHDGGIWNVVVAKVVWPVGQVVRNEL